MTTKSIIKRLEAQMSCKKCVGKMKHGVAIHETLVSGLPDFPGDAEKGIRGITLSPGGHGEVIECLKCEKCGWSITK